MLSVAQPVDWSAVAAPVVLAVGALVVLLVDAFAGPPRSRAAALVPAALTVATVAVAAVAAVRLWGEQRATFCVVERLEQPVHCSFVVDRFTLVFWSIVLFGTRRRRPTRDRRDRRGSDAAGRVELPAAVLGDRRADDRGLPGPDHAGGRAGGGFAAGFRDDRPPTRRPPLGGGGAEVLPGLGDLDRSDADGRLAGVRRDGLGVPRRRSTPASPAAPAGAVALVGTLLTVVGLAFKVAAVPFHMWVPDTYVGAPVAVAAYLSVVSKSAGFVGLMLVLSLGLRVARPTSGRRVMAVLAALTMTVGNVLALRQQHAVRLLAWSSVAQAGYILVPFGAAAAAGTARSARRWRTSRSTPS